MPESRRPRSDDIEQLLLNAQLRDELEPFFDESISRLNVHDLPTQTENAYLASMLAWERAPVVPISQWFEPELVLPHPSSIFNEKQLHALLWDTIRKLFDKQIVLLFTDHLSDRELYSLIYRDILPSQEKKFDRAECYLHWDCADSSGDPDTWLRYYASDEERQWWAEHWQGALPAKRERPYPRQLPQQGA